MKLIHFWFCPASEKARMALSYKKLDYGLIVPDFDDDETFFELGVARAAPVVVWADGKVDTDPLTLWTELDRRYPQPSLMAGLALDQWQALLDWHKRAEHLLERLYAPLRPAFRGIGDNEAHLAAYKASVKARLRASLEALANDRYAAFAQLDNLTHFKELGSFVRHHGFYAGAFSAADILLTANLFCLQLLDGITLPIDLMYYFERVQETCAVDLRAGFLAG